MSLSITVDVNDARLTGLLDYLNSGALAPKVQLYGGTRPALPSDAPGTTMLCQITLDDPCGTIVGHQLVLAASTLAQVVSSGIAVWARIVKDGETTGIDGDVSNLAGTGDIKISDTTLWSGAFVSLVSAVLV